MSTLARTWIDAFRGHGPDTALDRQLVGMPGFRSLETATQMVALSFNVIKAIFTPPVGWVREMVVESSRALRLVTVPMMFASTVYVLAFGSVLFGQVIFALGAPDRLAPGFYVGIMRELAPWLTYMVLAGAVGSALAGDLGARRIREELDALDVLGVDKLRALIVPRVVAITLVCLILSFLVVLVNESCAIVLNQVTVDQGMRTSVEAVVLVMNPYDVGALALKSVIVGFFLGIVACQKGLSARGGAEGVGRAVSETVVISFFGLWLLNSLYNTGYLTIFPETLGIRG